MCAIHETDDTDIESMFTELSKMFHRSLSTWHYLNVTTLFGNVYKILRVRSYELQLYTHGVSINRRGDNKSMESITAEIR